MKYKTIVFNIGEENKPVYEDLAKLNVLEKKLINIMQRLFLCFFILCFPTCAFPTNDNMGLRNYANNIRAFNLNFQQEKVYVHMDNRSYYIGDTIWFKAYVMNASTLHPTQTSGVLYVELLNDFGAEIARKKLQIKNGMCHGDFVLKDEYRTGYYEIRAYTRNMLNFGESNSLLLGYGRPWTYVEPAGAIWSSTEDENTFTVSPPIVSTVSRPIEYDDEDTLNTRRRQGYRRVVRADKKQFTFNRINECVFSRVFPVYIRPKITGVYEQVMEEYPHHPRLAKPKEDNSKLRPEKLLITFYPEGGMLIDEVESVIAFEAEDQWHRKQNVTGHIEDLNGNIITEFSSTTRGRGTFTLCPSRKEPYIVYVNYKDKVYKRLLPYIERNGYGITLTPPIDAEADVPIVVKASPYNDTELIGWTLQCRGTLIANDTISIAPGSQEMIHIPSSLLNGGVNQFTLYNTRGEVLADRLFWVTPRNNMAKATIANIPDSVSPYEKVSLNIKIGEKRKKSQESYLSLAVTDASNRANSYDTRNIWSELLLSSELKGFIEDVDSYFQHDSKQEMADDIDLLMLVQGWRWRRYEWHTMAGSEPYTQQYAPEKGLGIDGYIIGETYEPHAQTHMTNAYSRIFGLAVEFSLGENGMLLNNTVLCDSAANYSVEIDKSFYGKVPLTIRLTDVSGTTENRLWNSQIVINRSFAPQPQRYSYYETSTSILPIGTDTSRISLPDKTANQSELKDGIYSDRPEMVIDYEQEWNWIIDRGIPCQNYILNDDTTTMHRHYYLNFPYLSYSLTRMQNVMDACVKADSVFAKYRGAYHVPYVMPKRVKVYSNLLARALDYNDAAPTSLPANYLIVEHCDSVENPEHPPYLPNNGVRQTYFEGYSSAHEFYSPDYSQIPLPENGDYRRTLYWNPELKTDHRGRASVSFYNNARTKHLHIRAEGFTRNGEFIVYDSERL